MNPLSLPWSVGQRYGLLKTEIVDASGRAIAVAWTHEQSSGEREPTPTKYGAEVLSLIVRAVNAHDELVAVLRDVLRIATAASIGITGNQPRLERARVALAKATGEGA